LDFPNRDLFGRGGRRGRKGRLLFARRKRLGLRADDLRFDDDVVGAADHQQMFDIVAAHQNELALTVQGEGVDQAKPRLARPAAARKTQPMAKQRAIGNDEGDDRNDGDHAKHRDLQSAIVAQRKIS